MAGEQTSANESSWCAVINRDVEGRSIFRRTWECYFSRESQTSRSTKAYIVNKKEGEETRVFQYVRR